MDTTITSHLNAVDSKPEPSADAAEPTGTVWIDFGDGGGARWADLDLSTLDQICAHIETIKPADTLT